MRQQWKISQPSQNKETSYRNHQIEKMFKKHTLPSPFSFHCSLFSTKEFPWFVNKILVELMEVIYQTTCLQNWENIANIRAAAMQASIFAPRQNNCIFIMNQNTSPLHQVFLPLIESSQRPPQKD